MLNFIYQTGRIFRSFAHHFASLFGKKLFISFSVYLVTLMMEHKRASIQSLADKNLISSYQQLQYFLSEAKWDSEELRDSNKTLIGENSNK